MIPNQCQLSNATTGTLLSSSRGMRSTRWADLQHTSGKRWAVSESFASVRRRGACEKVKHELFWVWYTLWKFVTLLICCRLQIRTNSPLLVFIYRDQPNVTLCKQVHMAHATLSNIRPCSEPTVLPLVQLMLNDGTITTVQAYKRFVLHDFLNFYCSVLIQESCS